MYHLASILAHSSDLADEWECVIQLSFALFCPNSDLCGDNSLFVARSRALNIGSRQKGVCWKEGDVKWLRSENPLIYYVGVVELQRNVSIVSAVVCVFSLFCSPVLIVIICHCPTLQLHQHCTLFFWIFFLVFVNHTGKCNYALCVISSVNGVAAALSAGLVHGRPPEFAAGTHHYVFLGGSHIP